MAKPSPSTRTAVPTLTGAGERRALTQELRAELLRQCELLPASRAREAHLAQLADPNLGVVVTGQQVGLFLGPALSFYKAATAVCLARQLQAAGAPTLPVFWLQSEDHDFDEVQSVIVLDKDDQPHRVAVEHDVEHRVSMAERTLGTEVVQALSTLEAALEEAPYQDEALALVRRHYRPSAGWVGAFSATLAEVFADDGLLVFSPRTSGVARLLQPMYRRALESAVAVEQAVQRGATGIEAAGEQPGITPRTNCSLFFFHPDGPRGPRYRLTRDDERWCVPRRETHLTTSTLLSRLEREPLAFSTSSLLRVVGQQTLFPVVAQVAGPAEAHYLRQVPPLLETFDAPELVVTPRTQILATDARTRRRLTKLGLRAVEFDTSEAVLRRMAEQDDGVSGSDVSQALERAVAEQLDRWSPELLATDPNLKHALSRTLRHVSKGAAGLARRIDRARMLRDTERAERVARVGRWLTPGGTRQERSLGAICLIARFGLDSFKTAVFRAVEQHLDDLRVGHAPTTQEVSL